MLENESFKVEVNGILRENAQRDWTCLESKNQLIFAAA